jgi:hypothetical protein
MKKTVVLGLALALIGGVAYANYCARDYVPAATLLVPYAVVDLNADGTPNPDGYTTILSVTNVSSPRALIHVTVWDPLSQPVVDFDEVLSGYDVWTINFRDLMTGHFDYFDTEGQKGFWNVGSSDPHNSTDVGPQNDVYGPTSNRTGKVYPLKAPADTDSQGKIGNPGALSGCQFPYSYHPEYGAGIIDGILGEIAFIQSVSYGYTCGLGDGFAVPAWIKALDPNRAFFYVTVDWVSACSQSFPSDSGYWTSGVSIGANNNVLLGDVIYLNSVKNYSESIPAVSIESDPQAPASGIWTFYADTASNARGVDDREPLATAFAFRYYNFGTTTSDLVVWKSHYDLIDIGTTTHKYRWDYCTPYIYFAWDENENSKSRSGGPSGFSTPEPNVLPLETQDVPLTVANFNGLMPGNGWMLLVFDPTIYPYNSVATDTTVQAWAGVRYLSGGYSTMLEAATMANAFCFGPYPYTSKPWLGTGQALPQLSTIYNYTDGNNAPAKY